MYYYNSHYYWIVRRSLGGTWPWSASLYRYNRQIGNPRRFKTWQEAMDWAAN